MWYYVIVNNSYDSLKKFLYFKLRNKAVNRT
nr:MAG TPA: hypothetical protein [Caudoviricetes sp.]